MFIISEKANAWFSRFPNFKVIFQLSAVNLPREAQSSDRVQLRNLKFPIVSNVNPLQILQKVIFQLSAVNLP